MNRIHLILPGVLASCLLSGCVTTPSLLPSAVTPAVPVTKASALRRVPPEALPVFSDDADTESLRTAALQSASYFRQLPVRQAYLIADDTYTARDLAESMESFAGLLQAARTPAEWLHAVRDQFVAYQSVGTTSDRAVTFSSYYEPILSARLQPDTLYCYPLYSRPDDLVDVDLGLFDPAWDGARLAGRRQGQALVPYWTRGEIDGDQKLAGRKLEIAWAKNPMDIFFLQIEGSGWLDVGDGKPLRIRYDGHNGRKYRSVGQHVIASGRIPAKQFNHAAFLRYMDRHPRQRQALLNVNERYIFFRIDTSSAAPDAYGNIDVPLTPGRSIATDPKLFPKGLLAWIRVGALARFVLNQDEGGAIQGPGRVDFFVGHGTEAEGFATHFWDTGQLYFLIKRKP
ncbi:MAG: MltA domain-containing protein [Elusimicrobiota bacterium]|jgi:membrane-bound lytic murein transglycosylase A